jgi:LysM repeat protein
MSLKKMTMIILALIILVGVAGFTARPAQAANCSYYHIVRPGESLYWIGRYYGYSWTYLAQYNGISNPRLIYPGQRICLPSGTARVSYKGSYYYPWSYAITKVVPDDTIQIKTSHLPSNVLMDARMGRYVQGGYEWENVGQLDTDAGGSIFATFNIPPSFAGESRIIMRLVQTKQKGNVVVDRPTPNVWTAPAYRRPGYGGRYYYYGGIPTIWIVSVVRNSEVTFRTNNFPPGLTFDVLMGPMGTRGVNGYHVGTLNSGSGGVMDATYPIPGPLYNHRQISIRTQNLPTGYYSYNWFYNNTTP